MALEQWVCFQGWNFDVAYPFVFSLKNTPEELPELKSCLQSSRDFRFLWQHFHFKDCWDVAQRGVQSPLCGAQAVKLFVWELLLKHSGPGLRRTPGVLLARQRSHHPSRSDGSSFVRHLSLAQGGCPQPEEAPHGIWNSTRFKFTFPDTLIKKWRSK